MTLYRFTVTGKSTFPLDMLRYDQCWPFQTKDVDLVIKSIKRTHYHIDIQLTGLKRPQHARWASFGWTVSDLRGMVV